MKKLTIILLTLVLCFSVVFAADVAAKVSIYASFGDEGFSISRNEGIWKPNISLSVDGDKAGATFQLFLGDWGQTIGIDTSIWVAPDFDYRKNGTNVSGNKLHFGMKSTASYKGGVAFVDPLAYAKYEFTREGDNFNLGVAYKPQGENSTKNSSFYVMGEVVGHQIKENNFIHLDAITKLNIVDGKASLDYALAEADWIFGEDQNSLINRMDLSDYLGFDEELYYYNGSSNPGWLDGYEYRLPEDSLAVGLRYKYYANESKKSGVYGYALMKSNFEDFGLEAEAEVGMAGADLVIKTKYNADAFSELSYFGLNLGYGKEAFNMKVSDIYAKATYSLDEVQPYLYIQYRDKSILPYNIIGLNTDLDGIFVKPGMTGSFGICGYDFGVILGVDSAKNFKWKTILKNQVGL